MMLAQFIMHLHGWHDAWFPLAGESSKHGFERNACYVGIWTGPQLDLICVKRCNTNEEANRFLSPPGRTMLDAAIRAAIVLRSRS